MKAGRRLGRTYRQNVERKRLNGKTGDRGLSEEAGTQTGK